MPDVGRVLAWKVGLSLVVALALLFFPFSYLPWLGLPEYDTASLIFVRALGGTCLALVVVEAWGWIEASSRRAAVVAALAETTIVALLAWHFVFYGYLATWPVLGKVAVSATGGVASLLAVLFVATGWGVLVGRSPARA